MQPVCQYDTLTYNIITNIIHDMTMHDLAILSIFMVNSRVSPIHGKEATTWCIAVHQQSRAKVVMW